MLCYRPAIGRRKLDLTGSHIIRLPQQIVWDALNDVEVLKSCIPGCEELEWSSKTMLDGKISTKIGPIKAKFKGEITISNVSPPTHYTISGKGKGGVAGFASGSADVNLEEDGSNTLLTYSVTATVGGKIAQIGARLVQSAARKLADEFFDNFVHLMEKENV
jgi:uncharacterized protein